MMIKSKKEKILSRKTLLSFALLIIASCLYVFAMESVIATKSQTVEFCNNNSFDSLYAHLELLYKQASMSAETVAKNIEKDLNEQNLDQIKDNMDSGVHDKTLRSIIHKHAKDVSLNNMNSFKNSIIVMTQYGIVEDFNRERSISSDKERDWKTEIENSYNPELKRTAINNLINHANKMVAMEDNNHISSSDHEKITDVNYSTLKRIFMNEGVEGFKNYQFMAASYITDTGDIFGQPDITHGVRMYNHKLIVVQEFNLYDQLLSLYDTRISEFDNKAINMENKFNGSMNLLYLLGIFYIVGIVALLFYSTEKYNSRVDEIKKETDIDNSNNSREL